MKISAKGIYGLTASILRCLEGSLNVVDSKNGKGISATTVQQRIQSNVFNKINESISSATAGLLSPRRQRLSESTPTQLRKLWPFILKTMSS